jgi:hypothetical protein
MDRGTFRSMLEFHFQNKFEKLVHLVGFITRKCFVICWVGGLVLGGWTDGWLVYWFGNVWLCVFRTPKPGVGPQCQISRSDSLEILPGLRGCLPLSAVEPKPPSPTCGPHTSLQLVTDSSWNWANKGGQTAGPRGTTNRQHSGVLAHSFCCQLPC